MAAPASAEILATRHASPPVPSSQTNMIQHLPSQQPIAGPSRYNGQSSHSQPFVPSIFPNLNTTNLPASVNLNDPEVLQRILLAQQAQQGSQRNPSQQQQQPHKQPTQRQLSQNGLQGIQRRPSGGVDGDGLGNSASPSGHGNTQGASKEAVMRQMQALESSHAVRNHVAQHGASAAATSNNTRPSQVDGTRSSILPSPPSAESPLVNQSQNGNPSNPLGMSSSGLQANGIDAASQSTPPSALVEIEGAHASDPAMTAGAQITEDQKQFMFRLRAAQQQQAQQGPQLSISTANQSLPPTSSAQPGPRPPGARPPQSLSDQRRQFITSLVVFHHQNHLPLPAAVFNGERDGSVKVGPAWVEVFDLFAMVMRNGGAANALRLPAESPAWVGFLASKGVPKPLPEPLQLALPADAQPMSTTNPVQYLVSIYLTCLRGFEDHLVRQRTTLQHRQVAAMTAAGTPPLPLPDINPAQLPSAISAVSPATAMLKAPNPGRPSGTPPASAGSDIPALSVLGASDATNTSKNIAGAPTRKSKAKPPMPTVQTAFSAPTAEAANEVRAGTPDSAASGKKRKRERKEAKPLEPSMSIANAVPTAIAADTVLVRPSTPKRARYKVEYRPLHHPVPLLGGWDERAISSTFSKNNLSRSTRSIHELGVVDMEAVLMGLRSRLPRELGYALTVLSMLSMPHPEENIGGLPLLHLVEIYMEILELMSEAAFGEGGYDVWLRERTSRKDEEELRLSYLDLEVLGRDTDLGLNTNQEYRDQTGGETDIILACLNILRNFSILPENQPILARPAELLVLLSRISDCRLCRFGTGAIETGKPYSLLELARVRRDCVVILDNVGQHVGLSRLPFDTVQSAYYLLASFLTDGCEHNLTIDNIYGSSPSTQDSPPPVILSIYRAVEAFGKLAASDANREVLSRLPPTDLVHLFAALIKLLPTTKRAQEAMHTVEDFLGYTECIALSLYSLAFLAPPGTRAAMCSVPGAISIITRLIFDTGPRTYDFKTNPFAVLCRRLCETLGTLNGTMSASGGLQDMSFSAHGGGGKGWKFASDVVDRGLLAGFAERLGEMCSIKGLDGPAFGELDGMWWDPQG